MEEDFVELLAREPFVPFTVALVSGDRYLVASADLAISDGSCLNLYHVRPDGRDVIRLEHISVIELRESVV